MTYALETGYSFDGVMGAVIGENPVRDSLGEHQ